MLYVAHKFTFIQTKSDLGRACDLVKECFVSSQLLYCAVEWGGDRQK